MKQNLKIPEKLEDILLYHMANNHVELRDQFAIHAPEEATDNYWKEFWDKEKQIYTAEACARGQAEWRYIFADAMMKAREAR